MAPSEAISPRLSEAISDLAFAALEIPTALDQPYACRRLLSEAAWCLPLSRAAARTVIDIAREVLADDDARFWGVSP